MSSVYLNWVVSAYSFLLMGLLAATSCVVCIIERWDGVCHVFVFLFAARICILASCVVCIIESWDGVRHVFVFLFAARVCILASCVACIIERWDGLCHGFCFLSAARICVLASCVECLYQCFRKLQRSTVMDNIYVCMFIVHTWSRKKLELHTTP